jgi:amino acid permease
MIVLVVYIYGALCLKYASGAASFVSGISSTFYGAEDPDAWTKDWSGFDPYYLSIIIFATLSLAFCFGNIENSKYLQIVTGFARIITVILLYGSTLYYLFRDGAHTTDVVDFSKLEYLATAFGNTVFAFIFHHSISGIVYPIRPQK